MSQTSSQLPSSSTRSEGPPLIVASQKDTVPMQFTATDTLPSFKHLLLATDFSAASGAAFQTALEACNILGAELSLVHVFEYPQTATPPESGGLLLELQALRERSHNMLNNLCAQAHAAGIHCKAFMQDGLAPSSIIDIIAGRQIDLALLGTNAAHGFERLVFGSTAEAVIRKSPCPILTIGPRVTTSRESASHPGPIVFATDFDFNTIHAIRYAATFANVMQAPLHCLHVLPRTFEAGTQSEIVPTIMLEALHQLATKSGVVIEHPTFATTFGSEVSWAVVDYAHQHHARMIVLGVRQASLLASHVPEHITYRIITEAPCPVLTMAYASHAEGVHARQRLRSKVSLKNVPA